MERVAVIRDNGLVVNVILWGDHTADQLRNDGISDFEEVTGLDPRPGIGWTWTKADGYRPPKPYPSWTWGALGWQAPTAMPTSGGPYQWNEQTKKWDTIPTE